MKMKLKSDLSPPSAAQVQKALIGYFGMKGNLGNESDPVDELFFHTYRSNNRKIIFSGVFIIEIKVSELGSDQMKNSSATRTQSIIEEAGLSKQKSVYIKQCISAKIMRLRKQIAERLFRDFGTVALSQLRDEPTPNLEKYLCSLPGVGIKTARCVLMYSFKRKGFPADVHCLRIMTRLIRLRWEGQRAEVICRAGAKSGTNCLAI
jgi:hypothetical protein